MSISSIGSVAALQVPLTPQAKLEDEATESPATKAREAATGKDSPVPVAASSGKAVDIKV
ncbi:MAG: hypothetical protein IT562_21535 [Alphaproteobacteria bacterium]|nr:hypothetical protein [Alphaproteobacteria bacterium]